MTDRLALLLFLVLAGCKDQPTAAEASQICQDLCDELVNTCAYRAYPRMDSCLQGCTYEESEGTNVRAYSNCVRGAACDTFVILECAHAYGLQE